MFGEIAVHAGRAIMKTRDAVKPRYKSDGSPVTAADLAADEIIRRELAQHLPDIAVVTEESCTRAAAVKADRFILVDPLDGTREFIRGSTEFTVNIALIEQGTPVAGAVHAPALGTLYVGGKTAHCCRLASDDAEPQASEMRPIGVRPPPPEGWHVVISRSHLDPATKAWIERHRIAERRPAGSSLKFCLIAAGEADVYPRLGPTMEWDTAAGQAVLTAAGGSVQDLDGRPLRYGKPDFRNGNFVAWGKAAGAA
ncbi:MAG: 3'(2'),5'-bisphosphate nucleotidase CysQ [Bradyrhizobium sp.]|nr:3'(2'),5'-bisphosphate nucleotidase CysQ [Bradyrhizobium sp.]